MPRHDEYLTPENAKELSRKQLLTTVRRLMSSGMSSEDVKEWFVTEVPKAMREAARMGLRGQ
jgi:hypothetical protein